jgi:hypothetical protein
MRQFDDIPINQLKKMEGYQTGPAMYAAGDNGNNIRHV